MAHLTLLHGAHQRSVDGGDGDRPTTKGYKLHFVAFTTTPAHEDDGADVAGFKAMLQQVLRKSQLL